MLSHWQATMCCYRWWTISLASCFLWCASRQYFGTSAFHHLYQWSSLSSYFICSILFADDTKCCKRIMSFNDALSLQTDLNNLSKWCHENDISFHISKLCLVRFCNRARDVTYTDYTIDGTDIVSQDHCRDLGVIFSSDRSWTEHYHSISAKAYQTLGLIRRLFLSSVPICVKKLLFISLVKSRLTYCSQVWRPHYIKDIRFLERVQPRVTKYILNDFQSDYRSRLISLHLLPLMYTYELWDILFLVRNLQHPDPSFPITRYVSFSSSSTRAGHSLKLIHQTFHTHL